MSLPLEDAISSGSDATVDSISYPHTCTGSDLLLYTGMSFRKNDGQTLSSITYNSVPLTLETESFTSRVAVQIGHLVAPATGENTVIITLSASSPAICGGTISYTDVGQTTPVGTSVNDSAATGTAVDVVVSSATDEIVLDVVIKNIDEAHSVQDAGQTEKVNIQVSDVENIGISSEIGAASSTLGWTWTTSGRNAMSAIPIKPVADASLGKSQTRVGRRTQMGRGRGRGR